MDRNSHGIFHIEQKAKNSQESGEEKNKIIKTGIYFQDSRLTIQVKQ